jgi:hypothetical protein
LANISRLKPLAQLYGLETVLGARRVRF